MSTEHDVVRFYTRGRRIPLMLGKLPDGTRLAGGPYTSVQALAFGATLTLLWLSMPIWNQMGLGLGNVVVLLGLPFLATMAARKVRLGGRSPRSVALGVLSGYLQPATGRLQGRTVPRLRTSRVRGRVVLGVPRPAAQQVAAVPAAVLVTAAVPLPEISARPAVANRVVSPPRPRSPRAKPAAVPAGRAMTNLERLLAAAEAHGCGDAAEVEELTCATR